jgi:hypothetical protein
VPVYPSTGTKIQSWHRYLLLKSSSRVLDCPQQHIEQRFIAEQVPEELHFLSEWIISMNAMHGSLARLYYGMRRGSGKEA